MNVGILGVGVGKGAILGFRPPKLKVALMGVATEPSEPSGLETERFRCFKLSEDLFFLIPIGGPLPVFGDTGAKLASLDMALPGAGVAGETVKVVSAGLGIRAWGEGAISPG